METLGFLFLFWLIQNIFFYGWWGCDMSWCLEVQVQCKVTLITTQGLSPAERDEETQVNLSGMTFFRRIVTQHINPNQKPCKLAPFPFGWECKGISGILFDFFTCVVCRQGECEEKKEVVYYSCIFIWKRNFGMSGKLIISQV